MFHSEILCVVLLAIAYSIGEEPETDSKIVPVNLNYECAKKSNEDSSKSPILLLHGFLGSKNSWKGTFEAMAFLTGRKVCAVDLRNHGDSPWDNETSVAAMAADIPHLLDSLHETKAVIIGESLGGDVAMHVALSYPERVDRFVVEDLSTRNLPPEMVTRMPMQMKLLLNAMDSVPEGTSEDEAKKIIMTYITDLMRQFNVSTESESSLELSLTCSDGKCRWKANMAGILSALEKDFSSFWSKKVGVSETPALFIYGTESPFKVADDEENILKMFPRAKLIPIEGANHIIHYGYPQFMDEVVKFLASD